MEEKYLPVFFKLFCPARAGGPEDQLMAADPRDEVLGPLDARLETCADCV